MSKALEFPLARTLAESLMAIGEERLFWPAGAIDGIANDLCRWCKGAFLNGVMWTAEEQAWWLVTEARETWTKWQGVSALRAMFRAKFEPEAPVAERQVYSTPPPAACAVCNDTGWEPYTNPKGYVFVKPCTACHGKPKPVEVCPECAGKETKLLDGCREPCNRCLTPERRVEIREFLNQQKGGFLERPN